MLGLQIIVAPSLEEEEIKILIKQMECAELAQTKFITGELSLSDYCDILQLCEINVDDYLITVEDNLSSLGVL